MQNMNVMQLASTIMTKIDLTEIQKLGESLNQENMNPEELMGMMSGMMSSLPGAENMPDLTNMMSMMQNSSGAGGGNQEQMMQQMQQMLMLWGNQGQQQQMPDMSQLLGLLNNKK